MRQNSVLPLSAYRGAVLAVVVSRDGWVLVGERIDRPGAWEFPQGGLQGIEDPTAAPYRELKEEMSIPRSRLELLGEYHQPMVVPLPRDLWSQKHGRGLVLFAFLFRLREGDDCIDVNVPNPEFRDWKWERMSLVVRSVVAFKRPVYERLHGYFGMLTRFT